MRKRSEVSAPDPRQQELPGADAPKEAPAASDAPANVKFKDGILFITCPDCSLPQSQKTAEKNGNGLSCLRCKAPLDPDGAIAKLIARRAAGEDIGAPKAPPPAAPEEPPPAPKPAIAPPPPAKEHPQTEAQVERDVKRAVERDDAHEARAAKRAEPLMPNAISLHIGGDAGSISVTYGKDVFTPRPFNTFEVGPFTAQVSTRPGESLEDAGARAYDGLRRLAEREFQRKGEDFLRKLGVLNAKLSGAGQ